MLLIWCCKRLLLILCCTPVMLQQDVRHATVEAGPEVQSRGRNTRNNARMHPANK